MKDEGALFILNLLTVFKKMVGFPFFEHIMKIIQYFDLRVLFSGWPFYCKIYERHRKNHVHTVRTRNMCNTLWAVVNLNLNRTCPVCTGLPDYSVY